MATAIILIGGPNKGTRFRPLSFKVPKPLFPLAQHETIYYHIQSCHKYNNSPSSKNLKISSIFIIGSYPSSDHNLTTFLNKVRSNFKNSFKISYLQEYENLGTAGAVYHFRDLYLSSENLLIFNGDVLCDFPIAGMVSRLKNKIPDQQGEQPNSVMLCKISSSKRSTLGNCIVKNSKIIHFVEKPLDLLPTHISCGCYLLNTAKFLQIAQQVKLELSENSETSQAFSLEQSIFPKLVDQNLLLAEILPEKSGLNWIQIKTADTAITANKFVLQNSKIFRPELAEMDENLTQNFTFIHPSSKIDSTAKIGPNVTINENCVIGPGVRISESIILPNCQIEKNSCIINSIIGWNNSVGAWSHIEGVLPKVNPNLQHEIIENIEYRSRSKSGGLVDLNEYNKQNHQPMGKKIKLEEERESYFESDGTLKKLVTILGHDVVVNDEMLIYSCLILPGKTINYSVSNQIVL